MTENETHEQETERLAEQEQTRLRLERIGGTALPTAQAQTERKISPISLAAMRGKPIQITVANTTFVAKGLSVLKKQEYFDCARQWPQFLVIAVALPEPKEGGIDFQALADYQTASAIEQHKDNEQERAAQCVERAALLTDSSRQEERDACAYHPKPRPDPFTIEDVCDWMLQTELIEFPAKDHFIFEAIWLFVETTPGIAWPKTYHDESEGEGDDLRVVGYVQDAPPVGCVWLDDYVKHFQLSDYVDLFRVLNAIAGRHAGSLVERFCQIA